MSQSWPTSITLHQLRVLAAVAREQSFARAAEWLYLSEATVSGQVKDLEKLVGLRLLERSSGRRQVELTEAGRILLGGYTKASGALETAVSALHELRGGKRAALAFGAGPHFAVSLLPVLCDAFQRSHPGTAVCPQIDRRQHLIEHLLRRRLDLAVVIGPAEDRELVSTPLVGYEVLLVGVRGHRLSLGDQLAPFRELRAEPFILPGAFASVRRELERRAAEAGFALQVALELSNVGAQIQAVASGIGIAALTSYSAQPRIAAGQLSALRVEGFPLHQVWHVAFRRDHLTPEAQIFRDYLLKHAPTVKPTPLT